MRRYFYDDKGFHPTPDSAKACWINISDPDRDDICYLIGKEGVPPILLEYLEDKDERPRVERNGDWMMTIVRVPVECDNGVMPYTTVPFGIISNSSDRMITVCYHNTLLPDSFAEHSCQISLETKTVSEFTLRIFFSTAYWYLEFLRQMSEYVIGTEKSLEKSIENEDLKQLMRLQKSLVLFNTSIKGDVMVLERIQKIYGNELNEDLAEDVDIEMKQADTTAAISNDIIKATMDSYASIISNNVNNIMKRMSALSIILIVPTFVASLYGMNVDILISSPYAFWIILGIAAVLTILAFLALRKLRWL